MSSILFASAISRLHCSIDYGWNVIKRVGHMIRYMYQQNPTIFFTVGTYSWPWWAIKDDHGLDIAPILFDTANSRPHCLLKFGWNMLKLVWYNIRHISQPHPTNFITFGPYLWPGWVVKGDYSLNLLPILFDTANSRPHCLLKFGWNM